MTMSINLKYTEMRLKFETTNNDSDPNKIFTDTYEGIKNDVQDPVYYLEAADALSTNRTAKRLEVVIRSDYLIEEE